MSFVIALAAVSPAFAQGDKQEPKQAPAEVTPNEARQWMQLFDKVVDTVVANKEDCGKMATGLNAVVDANQDAIAIARDAKTKGKKLPQTVQQHMIDGARRMLGALDKCGRDEKVGAAFRRIDLGGRK
ncbi:MAG TPA: hypothetical protein VMZ53_29435 [Kofleriaceae bacterium]|nr:hypothetical protein [Kofleriaceae bacterium]